MTFEALPNVPVLTEAVDVSAADTAGPDYQTLRVQAMSLLRHTASVAAPVLPDDPAVEAEFDGAAGDSSADNAALPADHEMLIAELQTEIAASTFALADRIMRTAFAEMEATVFQQISGRLRSELPEMIDELLRERLGNNLEY